MITSLGASKLFTGISDAVLGECADHCTVVRVKRRSTILEQGEAGVQLYSIIQGLVRVARVIEDGDEFTLRIAGRGDVFGDDSLFGDALHSASATALVDCCVAMCRIDYVKALLMRYPVLGLNVAKYLRESHDRTLDRIQRMEFNRAHDHLLALLYELAFEFGSGERDGKYVEVPLTQAELASLIGTSRETVSYELADLAREGYIGRRGRKIVVPLTRRAA